jgi:hypothetical protein
MCHHYLSGLYHVVVHTFISAVHAFIPPRKRFSANVHVLPVGFAGLDRRRGDIGCCRRRRLLGIGRVNGHVRVSFPVRVRCNAVLDDMLLRTTVYRGCSRYSVLRRTTTPTIALRRTALRFGFATADERLQRQAALRHYIGSPSHIYNNMVLPYYISDVAKAGVCY